MASIKTRLMPGDTGTQSGAAELLEWNQRKALAHMLAIEEHLAELTPTQIVHSWCIVKHDLLLCDHALEEAIGHAERSGRDSEPYRRFRQKILDLNIYPEPHIRLQDMAKLRTEFRHLIKDPTLGEECPLCSRDVEELKQVLGHETLSDIEDEMADRILTALSEKYKVPKPKLTISKECRVKDPQTSGWFREWGKKYGKRKSEIELCRGGVNAHVLIHEFQHYLAYLGKEDQNEDEIEQKALREFAHSQKVLNVKNPQYNVVNHGGGRKTMKYGKSAVAVLGGQLISQGISEYESTLEATAGSDVVTGIEVVGGGAALMAGATGKLVKSEMANLVLLVAGGGLLIHGAMRAIKKFTTPLALSYAPQVGIGAIPSPTGIPGGMAYQGASAGAVISAPVPGTRTWSGITRMTAGYPGVAQVDGQKFINIKV